MPMHSAWDAIVSRSGDIPGGQVLSVRQLSIRERPQCVGHRLPIASQSALSSHSSMAEPVRTPLTFSNSHRGDRLRL